MDCRDLEFWVGEAEKAGAEKEMAMMRAGRMAFWAEPKPFAEVYESLSRCVSAMSGEAGREIESNWGALKAIGRR